MSIVMDELGPLAGLVGTWEGEKGHDTAPSDDRGTEVNLFRERITFVPTGLVENHEQRLFGLRYATVAWRIGEENSFHEENGYWMWDPADKQVLRCFTIPRGLSVLAGGAVEPDAKTFAIAAEHGATTYGILANRFLEREFKMTRYQLTVRILGPDSWSYEEDTVLQLKGRAEPFHHVDKNTLTRVTTNA